MTGKVKTAAWVFIFLTGALAGFSLLIIDGTVDSFFNQEVIPEYSNPGFPGDLPMKQILLKYKDFNLDAWFLNADNAEFAVLFCHDATGNLYTREPLYRLFHELGVSVMTFDYRGFGKSGGEKPTFDDYATDIRRAYDKLRNQLKHQEKIIFYGQGIFVSETLRLAAIKGCDGIILENAIPSLGRLFQDPVRKFLLSEQFNLIRSAEGITCPLMFIHGSQNSRVSPEVISSVRSDLPFPSKYCLIDGAEYGEIAHAYPEDWKACVSDFLADVTLREKMESIQP